MTEKNITIIAEPAFLPWLAFFVSIVATAGVIYNIYLTRKTAKQLATLEFLGELQREMRSYQDRLLAMGGPQGIKDFSSIIADFMGKTGVLMTFLNKCEQLAIGLKHKIYDEKMVFDGLALELVELHELSKPFVAQIREGMKLRSKHYERVFINFEELVEKAKAYLAQK